MMNPTDLLWMCEGACVTHPDPDAWFTPRKPSHRTDMAINICNQCPVQTDCLTYALHEEGSAPAEDRAGIWGGKTPQQRANMRHIKRCIKCKTTPIPGRYQKCDRCITTDKWLKNRRHAT